KVKPTILLDTFFYWVTERHSIHRKRIAGEPAPWTDDPVLQKYAFTNVFRVYDRNTQYVVTHVINRGDPDFRETCFRVILFRMFTRIGTYEMLLEAFGELTWKDFSIAAYESVLREQDDKGVSLYGHAYIMPAPTWARGQKNYTGHLQLLQLMMDVDLPGKLRDVDQISDGFYLIHLFPSMGEFLSFQLMLDLNMVKGICLPEDWAICGPGAKSCLKKMFGENISKNFGGALQWLHDHQQEQIVRLGIKRNDYPHLFPSQTYLSFVDIEHALCETEKYARVAHPKLTAKGARIHIKTVYKQDRTALTATLPVEWAKVQRNIKPRKYRSPAAVGADEWEVERIVYEDICKGQPVYLLRWKGWSPHDDTWESVEDMGNAQELLDEWRKVKDSIKARI
ncbi:hypothetical protein OF83DRAFT_1033200, partial [Amylostereum chailletii]